VLAVGGAFYGGGACCDALFSLNEVFSSEFFFTGDPSKLGAKFS
jgi:hypothetical protein